MNDRPVDRGQLRTLIAPGLATLAALSVLVALGVWQLERKTWKEDLLSRMNARAYGEPVAVASERDWASWRPTVNEYTRVRLSGKFTSRREIPVHGLAKPGREAVPGYFLFASLQLDDGSSVLINRGFVPNELKDASLRSPIPTGRVTIIGLERAAETRGAFVPSNEPARNEWFVRDVGELAQTLGLTRVAPFYVDADSNPKVGGWPKGGQTQLTLKNDHLQYAITWFGLAAALVGVFTAFGWRRLNPASGVELPFRPGNSSVAASSD